MKPFDLAKAQAGHPLVMRDGRPVKFLLYVPEANEYSRVICLMGDFVCVRCIDGMAQHYPTQSDVMLADPPPVKVRRWVNIYQCGDDYTNGSLCKSESEAKSRAKNSIACACVEFEIPGDV